MECALQWMLSEVHASKCQHIPAVDAYLPESSGQGKGVGFVLEVVRMLIWLQYFAHVYTLDIMYHE